MGGGAHRVPCDFEARYPYPGALNLEASIRPEGLVYILYLHGTTISDHYSLQLLCTIYQKELHYSKLASGGTRVTIWDSTFGFAKMRRRGTSSAAPIITKGPHILGNYHVGLGKGT